MKLENLKENVGAWWDNLAEGWRHLRDSAASALTSFKPGEQTNLPGEAEIDAGARLPGRGWGMLGGDVFEDETRVVVRLEVPGMAKEDIDIEVREDALVISGEKRPPLNSRYLCASPNTCRIVPSRVTRTPAGAKRSRIAS